MDLWKNWGHRADAILCHGTAVSWQDRGCLILGPSGAGKSSLAAQLVALGCSLVADDRVWILGQKRGQGLMLEAPKQLSGQLELRGVGIMTLPHVATAPLDFAVDLSQTCGQRLPEPRMDPVIGHRIPVLPPVSAAALKLVLTYGYGSLAR